MEVQLYHSQWLSMSQEDKNQFIHIFVLGRHEPVVPDYVGDFRIVLEQVYPKIHEFLLLYDDSKFYALLNSLKSVTAEDICYCYATVRGFLL